MNRQSILAKPLAALLCVLAAGRSPASPVGGGDWFVGLITDHEAHHFDETGNAIQQVGGLTDIRGIDVGPDGDVYIADNNNQIGRFAKTNFQARTTVVGSSEINSPMQVRFGPDGDLYGIDTSLTPNRIKKWEGPLAASPFTSNGAFTVSRTELIGMQDFEFGPDGHIYVSNWKTPSASPNPSVERFNGTNGIFIDSFVSTNDANLVDVTGIAFGPDGHLYVANKGGSNQVLRYQGPGGASPGAFIDIFVSSGSGGMNLPQDLHFGNDSNLYVCSYLSFEVLRYQGPYGGSPGAFIDVFTAFSSNSSPLFLDQAPMPPLPPKRRLILHSDGKPVADTVFPYLPGTQTDACTLSLIHGFNRARYYRTTVAQPWPPGYQAGLTNGEPDELEKYLEFCDTNNYEAFWVQRMNDTHDTGTDEDSRMNFASNAFKQANPELLIGDMRWPTPSSNGIWQIEDFVQCPNGRWSSVDYAEQEVRDQAYAAWEEVCYSNDIGGLMLDFFRHPTTFRTTAKGLHATTGEVAILTGLMRRARTLVDDVGAQRGHPILLAVRTPDEPRYAKGLGLDIEGWMAEGLIDVWIACGYFRMQEWDDVVALGHQYGVAVWASMDDIRTGRPASTSAEAFRGRAMNMWNAGVDGIYMFNWDEIPPSLMFDVLSQIGDPATMTTLPKMYVADARNDISGLMYWLNGGEAYITRTNYQALPGNLTDGATNVIHIPFGDDLPAAIAQGEVPIPQVRVYISGLTNVADLQVTLNGVSLGVGTQGSESNRVDFAPTPAQVQTGFNQFDISLAAPSPTTVTLQDLQLWISYRYGIGPGDWFVGDYKDFGNGSVYHFNADGTFIEKRGGVSEPRGIDLGPNGNLYVGDRFDKIFRMLESDFQDLSTVIPTTNAISSPQDMRFGSDGNMYLGIAGSGGVTRWNGPNNPPAWGNGIIFATTGLTEAHGGICFGPNGDLYVVDTGIPGEIERYDGLTGARIGASPFVQDNTHIQFGTGLCFGSDRNLYVANAPGDNVLVYQGPSGASPGAYIGAFVAPGSGGLDNPVGLRFGNDGDLYVCSYLTGKVLRYEGLDDPVPGAFVEEFLDLGTGQLPTYLVQAPPLKPRKGVVFSLK